MSKNDFICSNNQLYSSKWINKDLIKNGGNSEKPDCIVIPANQEQLKKKIGSLGLLIPVITLENEYSFEQIKSQCNTTNTPHIVFMSQSQWDNKHAHEHYVLFLKWLQSLKFFAHFKLSVLALNALRGPSLNQITNPLDAVYLGLTQTFAKEMPHTIINAINIETLSEQILFNLSKITQSSPALSPLFLSDDSYSVKELHPIFLQREFHQKGFKNKGCYLILGGTGGLGSLLANYLCSHYQAKVILVGRKPLSAEKMTQYAHLDVVPEQVDLTCEDSVKQLLQRHPDIDGIIHSALVLDDASIMTMSNEKLLSVLAPKVQGTLNLVKAIAHRQFDFIMFFSSIQSFIANAGQANYTAACLAKDALAHMIEDVFHIKTHIINWGYWGEHGIVANDFYRDIMRSKEISSITAEDGLAVIEQCLQQNLSQVVMVKGSQKALQNMGINTPTAQTKQLVPFFNKAAPDIQYNKAMMDALEQYSRHQLFQVTKPAKVLNKYDKLWEAISHIHYTSSPNRKELEYQFPELVSHLNLMMYA